MSWLPLLGCGVHDYFLGSLGSGGTSGGTNSGGETQFGGAGGSTGGTSGGGGETTGGMSGGGGAGTAGSGGTESGGTAGAESGGSAGSAGSSGTAGATGDLVGWASISDCGVRGTIGGEGGPTVRPRTPNELDDAVRDTAPAIVEISGSIVLGDVIPQVTGDKTLIGVNGAELVGKIRVLDARNVILKNITFNGGGMVGDLDAVEIDGSSCVWVDHCEFVDGQDSNLDIVRGSDLVTVSWSKFHYVVKSDEHRLGSVCGNNNTDTPGKINVTFHHNWWAARIVNNMPSVRHGKVHVFNSYFSATGNDYCIAAGYMSKLLVQNNVFDGVNDPIIFNVDEDTAEVVESGNDYATATGMRVSRGAAFVPPYPYTLEDAAAAQARVIAEAGPR